MTQPEALRLADELLALHGPTDIDERAAAELRRLHEAHDWQYRMAGERLRRVEKLEAQRDALLEALLWIGTRCPQAFMDCPLHTVHREMAHDAGVCARAAIKKAEENT